MNATIESMKNNNYDYRYENDYQFRLEEQNHFLEKDFSTNSLSL
jgi:hypothetical protein